MEKIRTRNKKNNFCLKLKSKTCHWILRDISWGMGEETIKEGGKEKCVIRREEERRKTFVSSM